MAFMIVRRQYDASGEEIGRPFPVGCDKFATREAAEAVVGDLAASLEGCAFDASGGFWRYAQDGKEYRLTIEGGRALVRPR